MVSLSDIVGIVQMIMAIGGVVWIVSTIQTTTAVLGQTIKNLDKTVDKLEKTVEQIESTLNSHAQKIAVLEANV